MVKTTISSDISLGHFLYEPDTFTQNEPIDVRSACHRGVLCETADLGRCLRGEPANDDALGPGTM